tara:strand:+ start:1763 stop:1999 length:237 start_codon:yes stop_codon:yes gene_type:complete
MDMLLAIGTVTLTVLVFSIAIEILKYIYKQFKEFGSISNDNKPNKSFFSMFLEKKKLEYKIDILNKKKELEKLEENNK